MLTKDLIKFRRDKSKIYPEFIKKKEFEDKELLDLAEEFVSFFKVGTLRVEIKKFVEDISFKYFKYLRLCNCFCKILSDESSFSKDSFAQERMRLLLKAQNIRNSYCKDDKQLYQEIVEKDHLVVEDKDSLDVLDYDKYIDLVMNEESENIDIYKDHPDYSRIEEISYLEAKDLLGLYNTRVLEWFFKSLESIKIKTKIEKEDKIDILNVFDNNKIKIIDLKEDRKEEDSKEKKKSKKNKKESEEFLINKKDNKVVVEKIIQSLFYILEKDEKADIVVELDSSGIGWKGGGYRYFYMKLDNSIPFKYYNFKKIMNIETQDVSKNVGISAES